MASAAGTPKKPQSASAGESAAKDKRIRKSVRLHPDTVMHIDYWSRKHDMPENEYLIEAIEEKIARENGDYALPTLEQQRLNQLIDEVRAVSTNVGSLEGILTTSLDSLLQIARGDSYLLDEDDGELSSADLASGVAAGDQD